MKTKTKRFLSIIVSFIMILLVAPLSSLNVFAQTSEDFNYEVLKDGTAKINRYNGTTANLVIPSTIDGYKITSIEWSAFSDCSFLTSVIIPEGVTYIGNYAFDNCTLLADITIPDSVKHIGNYALEDTKYYNNKSNWENDVLYCGNHLIKAKENLSGNYQIKKGTVTIGTAAFMNCNYLSSITIPDSVRNIDESAFRECTSLTDIVIPNKVSQIGIWAFADCSSLTNINIPDGVTSISKYTFSGCTSLSSIKLPNSLTEIGDSSFEHCASLKEIILPEGVTYIGESAFLSCTSLANINIPNTVTSILLGAFSNCTSLTNIKIPESLTSIGNSAFIDCGLTEVFIPRAVANVEQYALGYFTSQTEYGGYIWEKIPGFKIYGYIGTAAETYAKENGFEFIALKEINNKDTGILVSEKEPDILPDGVKIKAEQLSAEDNKIIFDISLVKDGAEFQPNGTVTVKIPVHEGTDGSLLKVYREEANGTYTDMNAYFANGYMVFTTDHFSKYVLTTEELSSALPGDINGDGKVTAVDARWVLQIAAGTREVKETEKVFVDLNNDGKVTAVDARWVLQIAAGTRVI